MSACRPDPVAISGLDQELAVVLRDRVSTPGTWRSINRFRQAADPGDRWRGPRLNQRWSTRRACIDARRGELVVQFQADHGRPPTPVEALHLAQRATLETRDAKHEPSSEASFGK